MHDCTGLLPTGGCNVKQTDKQYFESISKARLFSALSSYEKTIEDYPQNMRAIWVSLPDEISGLSKELRDKVKHYAIALKKREVQQKYNDAVTKKDIIYKILKLGE